MALPIVIGEFGVVGNPEVRFTKDGKAWMKIRGVSKAKKRGPNGAWTDGESTFINILVFDDEKTRLATNLIESNLAARDSITVTGRLQMREYEHEGSKRTEYQINADVVGLSVRWKHHGGGSSMNVEQIKETLGGDVLEDAPF